MGCQGLAGTQVMAQSSLLTPTARISPSCMVSTAATESCQMANYFYRATHYMELHIRAAVPGMARCSRSTLTGQVLRPCTTSRQPLALILLSTATELVRMLD